MDLKRVLGSNRLLAVAALVVLAIAAVVFVSGLRSPGAGATGADVNVSEDNNGQTVIVAPNSTVHLVLHSTYWSVEPVSDTKVLQSLHDPVVTPDLAGHVPGSGAGTVAIDYKSGQNGTAQLHASRQTCGEALKCTGDQSSFSVTIVVKS